MHVQGDEVAHQPPRVKSKKMLLICTVQPLEGYPLTALATVGTPQRTLPTAQGPTYKAFPFRA